MANGFRERLEETEQQLIDAVERMESLLDELQPELITPLIAVSTPTRLERLATSIRELPGNWE